MIMLKQFTTTRISSVHWQVTLSHPPLNLIH